jgi:hypothetical protein
MWEPRRLTTLWASTACYRDSFTFYLISNKWFFLSRRICPVSSNFADSFPSIFHSGSRGSSVGIATGYRLVGRGLFSVGARGFSLVHSVRTGSGVHRATEPPSHPATQPPSHPATQPVGTGGKRKADHSPPSSTKIKICGTKPALPHTSSWHND